MKGVVYLERKDLFDFIENTATFALDEYHTFFIDFKDQSSSDIKRLIINKVSTAFSLEFEKQGNEKVVFWITNLDNEEKFTIVAFDDDACNCTECGDIVHPDCLHGGSGGLCSDCNCENERGEFNND